MIRAQMPWIVEMTLLKSITRKREELEKIHGQRFDDK